MEHVSLIISREALIILLPIFMNIIISTSVSVMFIVQQDIDELASGTATNRMRDDCSNAVYRQRHAI